MLQASPFGRPQPTEDELDELRAIVVGPLKRRVIDLEARVASKADDAAQVARVLPDAIRFRASQDDELGSALAPALAGAIREQARNDPAIFVEAISPVLGEAVRKAVADSMRSLVQTLNRTLEHSVSIRGLMWRIEALRTGKSFGEVVLAHTLVYRVEHVFLIHRETSLLLHRAHWEQSAVSENADLISGMLGAIESFVEDSLEVPDTEPLKTLQVGELSVWVERGRHTILAAVIRGEPPEALRGTLRGTLEQVEMAFAAELSPFSGDTEPFLQTEELLTQCLDYRLQETSPRPSFTLVVLLLALLGLVGWQVHGAWQERQSWRAVVDALDSTPGIVVTEASQRGRRVAGLLDPLAKPPEEVLSEVLPANAEPLDLHLRPYLSLEPELVVERARVSLRVPTNVDVAVADGVLSATGRASHAWLLRARLAGTTVPGVRRIDLSRVRDTDMERLEARAAELSKRQLRFVTATTRLVSGQEEALQAIAGGLRDLYDEARKLGQSFDLLVVGHTDSRGAVERNMKLSLERAESVRAALRRGGLTDVPLLAEGRGDTEPLVAETTPEATDRNRRVEFQVRLIEAHEGEDEP